MARTIYGNTTGAAAHKRYNDPEAIRARERMIVDALNELRAADPDGWEAWYDENIPDFTIYGIAGDIIAADIAQRIRKRAEEVKNA